MGKLYIEADIGCSVIVKRTDAESGLVDYLYDGDDIFEGDDLKITCTPDAGYSILSLKHGIPSVGSYTSFGSMNAFGQLVGMIICSSSDLGIIVTTVPLKYTLYISAGTGSTISVKRTNSPSGVGSIGTLDNGSTIYRYDELEISCEASEGYKITQLTVNDADFTSGSTYTVPASNVTTKSVADATGLVYIDNGSSIEAYQCFIDNGSGWDQYMPYIDNGSGWDLCS